MLVVACLRGGRAPFVPLPPMAESSYYGSIYPSVQNLLLAARAMGLGASLITLPLWSTTSCAASSGSRVGAAVLRRPARLAPWPLRPDHPQAGRRRRPPRPLRPPTLARTRELSRDAPRHRLTVVVPPLASNRRRRQQRSRVLAPRSCGPTRDVRRRVRADQSTRTVSVRIRSRPRIRRPSVVLWTSSAPS